MLKAHRVPGRVSRLGGSVVVRGADPIDVAAAVQNMPGVAWIAAGFGFESQDEMLKSAAALARLYLRRGDRFLVDGEGSRGVLPSDIGGAATSRILDAVRGARVSEAPKVRFRVAADGKRGVIGAEVRLGPGGVPTGTEGVSCMVSGGVHSSVTAWMAVLAGFRVKMVHVKVSDDSVLAVAKLYSELSYRADPRGLGLEVLEGGSASGAVGGYAAHSRQRVLGGFHAGGGGPPMGLRGRVAAPLYLMPEERFQTELRSLGLRPFDSAVSWNESGSARYTAKRFSGGPADVSDILDGLA